ncbi:hypothetical protein AY633_06630 [Planococcus maritimus]|nr:hypothetical protein AY633_06630 [Planococcus maritimus]
MKRLSTNANGFFLSIASLEIFHMWYDKRNPQNFQTSIPASSAGQLKCKGGQTPQLQPNAHIKMCGEWI